VNLDYRVSPFNVSVGVTSTNAAFTYNVEYTFDDANYLASIGSSLPPTWFFDTNLSTASSNGVSNYLFPVAAVRFTVTAFSAGAPGLLYARVLQGHPG
jgi:hypothetical protein